MVYQIYQAQLGIPIIGMGGINNADDAAEFSLVGADMIAVGTSSFGNRQVFTEIDEGYRGIISHCGFSSHREYVGSVISV